MDTINGFQDEAWKAVDALLYECGSPFKSGSQLKNGQRNFRCDFTFFGLPWLVFEGFCSPMLAFSQPSVHGLPGGSEELRCG